VTCFSRYNHRGLVARYGGEEFCLVLPETTVEGAAVLYERLRAALREHTFGGRNGKKIQVTVSVGLVELTSKDQSGNDLLSLADRALYESKRQGRDRAIAWTSLACQEPIPLRKSAG
jgi:two-component system, cell cycle response regulator